MHNLLPTNLPDFPQIAWVDLVYLSCSVNQLTSTMLLSLGHYISTNSYHFTERVTLENLMARTKRAGEAEWYSHQPFYEFNLHLGNILARIMLSLLIKKP